MREYKRKTQRGSTPKDVMEMTVKEVLIDKGPCRTVANKYDIPHAVAAPRGGLSSPLLYQVISVNHPNPMRKIWRYGG